MRVALDARRMQDNPPSGVGRMFTNLVPHLAPAVSVVLLTDGRRAPVPGPWEQHPLHVPRWAAEPVWLQTSVPRWLRRFDGVFHGTFNALPMRAAVPCVVTFHDLAFEHHHEDFRPDKRAVWRIQARRAASIAAAVTTLTNFVRDGLVDRYQIDPQRIFLSPPGIDPIFAPCSSESAEQLLARFGVKPPYVIALGGARRRGLRVAVDAWRITRQRGADWTLVVVGSEAPKPEPALTYVGSLDDTSWAALLAAAEAFCYPTRYEGFGMPALESIASGTPVVCAPVGGLPEVLGDAAEWCEEPSAGAMADGLARLLDEPAHRADLVQTGLARAGAAPTWSDSAAVLVQAYTMAAQG